MAQLAATAMLVVLMVWAWAPHTRAGRRTRARARLRCVDPRVGDRLRPASAPAGTDEVQVVDEMARAGLLEPGEARAISSDLRESEARGTDAARRDERS